MFIRNVLICFLVALPLAAQSTGVPEMYSQIRAEETNNSKIMWIIHEVTDVYGPRLTGTPSLKAAQDWAVKNMMSWGLANVHLEPWVFQPPGVSAPVPGWENIDLAADAMSPFHAQLMVKPLAWTPSTKGTVIADVVMLLPPGLDVAPANRSVTSTFEDVGAENELPLPIPLSKPVTAPAQPTKAELDSYLNTMKDRVRKHIVFVGKHIEVPDNFDPVPFRRPDSEWKADFDRIDPNRRLGGFGISIGRGPAPPLPEGRLTPVEVSRVVDQFLVDNGALVRINDAGRAYGVIVAQQNSTYDWSKAVPTLVLRNEDYGRISRIMADGTRVTLRIQVKNKEYPEGTTAYNVIAEIPGASKQDEVVMLGAHFDSWSNATGATDNGSGASMMMEAMRILAALHVKPQRTIRLALWSGEEEGLLGSLAYVRQHFGSFENPKPEYTKLDAYLNLDYGTSKVRGAGVFGPPESARMIRDVFMPFRPWGFIGVLALNSRGTGGTDSTSFSNAGLPGIGLSQDPFDYNLFTHHTNLDTYERISEEDVRQGAVEVAAVAYALATSDCMLPRFAEKNMPAPVAPRNEGFTAP